MARSRAKLQAVGAEEFRILPSDILSGETGEVAPISNAVELYLLGLADGSRATVRGRLDRVSNLLSPGTDATRYPWSDLTIREVTMVKATLAQSYSWVTVNSYIAAIKGQLRTCWTVGQMTTDAYQRATAVKAFRGTVVPAGRHISGDEFGKLFAHLAVDQSVKGRRDLALFAVARSTGARREELTNLDLEDMNLRNLTVLLNGKGRRQREVAIAGWCRGPVQAWLAVRKNMPGPLFAAVRHNNTVSSPIKRLTNPGMDGILRKRLAQFQLASFGWHDVRRSMVTDLLDSGADLEVVSKQAGHRDPKTTMRYSRRDAKKLQEVARNIPSPFAAGDAKTARENAKFDREFDGKPRPWVPDESDLEEEMECDAE